jgi:hypothetical protein
VLRTALGVSNSHRRGSLNRMLDLKGAISISEEASRKTKFNLLTLLSSIVESLRHRTELKLICGILVEKLVK